MHLIALYFYTWRLSFYLYDNHPSQSPLTDYSKSDDFIWKVHKFWPSYQYSQQTAKTKARFKLYLEDTGQAPKDCGGRKSTSQVFYLMGKLLKFLSFSISTINWRDQYYKDLAYCLLHASCKTKDSCLCKRLYEWLETVMTSDTLVGLSGTISIHFGQTGNTKNFKHGSILETP